MEGDERALRDVIARWHAATRAGDVDTVLGFIAEDAVFLVAGGNPMRGRNAFAAGLRSVLASDRIESSGEVVEVKVSGELAYCWTTLDVAITPRSGGDATRRSGSSLSIFRKDASGAWRLFRDANLLAPRQ